MQFLDVILKKQLVGVDIGVSGIKALEVSQTKVPQLIAYNRIPLPWEAISLEGEVRNRAVVVDALKRLFAVGSFSSKNVAVGAFGRSIMSKRITVPVMTEEELEHQLYWEAEQYIPFNASEVNLDFAILGPASHTLAQEPKMDVLLVAAKKEFIESLKSMVREAGLEPVIIDTQAFALGNAFEHNYASWIKEQGAHCCALVDFGAGSTKISIVEGTRTSFHRDIQPSGSRCSEFLADRLGVTVEEAEQIKISQGTKPQVRNILTDYAHSLADEISRTLDFFLSQSHDNSIDAIFYCGGAVQMEGIMEVLTKKMPAPLYPLNPIKHVIGSGQGINRTALDEVTVLGTVATGLSLRKWGDQS